MKKWISLILVSVTMLSLSACDNPFASPLTAKEAYIASFTEQNQLDAYEVKGDFAITAKTSEKSLKPVKESVKLLNNATLSLDVQVDSLKKNMSVAPTLTFSNKESLQANLFFDLTTKKVTMNHPFTQKQVDVSAHYDDLLGLYHAFMQDDIVFLSALDDLEFVEQTVSETQKTEGISRIISLELSPEKASERQTNGMNVLSKLMKAIAEKESFNSPATFHTTLYLNEDNHLIKQELETKSEGNVNVTLTGVFKY